MPTSPEVDAWMARYENPMKPVVQRIREIVLGADRRIEECIKWQAPTFAYRGNLASFFPKSKQHASLMFHTGATIPGNHPRLEGGGGMSRVMKVASMADANAAKADLVRLVKAWCEMREADGASKPAGKPKPSGAGKPKPSGAGKRKPSKPSKRTVEASSAPKRGAKKASRKPSKTKTPKPSKRR